MGKVNYKWLDHLKTPAEKKDFEESIKASTYVLSRLQAILDEWKDELAREEFNYTQFDSPNWEVKQAFKLGDRARIDKVKDLLSFLE